MESQRTFRSLEAQAGQRTCFELLAPSRGKLTRLVVTQVGGDPQDLTVRIYNAAVACQGSSESSIGEAPEGEPAADPLHYQIGAPFESTEAGLVQHVFDTASTPRWTSPVATGPALLTSPWAFLQVRLDRYGRAL